MADLTVDSARSLPTRYKAYRICCNLQQRLCEEFTPSDDDDGEEDGDGGMPPFDEPYTRCEQK